MSQSISEYLKEKAYPSLDAVQTGLLSSLDPSSLQSGKHYRLVCIKCKKKEAFYYPEKAYIVCNRRNNCGHSATIWDVLEATGMSGGDILETICRAANVPVPERERNKDSRRTGSGDASGVDSNSKAGAPQTTPGKAIFQVTQALAKKHPELLKRIQLDRKFTDDQMAAMRLGVYTTPDEVLEGLLSLGVTRDEAIDKGYVEVDANNPNNLGKGLTQRVVGYWPHSDGEIRLWGRLAEGAGDKFNKKYRFALNLQKDIPYLVSKRNQTILCLIEGTFDAWSLYFMGYWAGSTGGANVTAGQAGYLVTQGVQEACIIIDGDDAGYDGAITSIRNLESVGIVTYVVALGQGMDDPDEMRQQGRDVELKQLIQGRMNSGEYLARLYGAYALRDHPYMRGMRRILSATSSLSPISMHKWTDFSRSIGIPMYTQATAVTLLQNLLAVGLEFTEASNRVKDRTGYRLTMEEANHG